MKPILYTSLDVDAPKITSTKGTIINVLKKCLVTGYGDKPSLGWDILYEDLSLNKMAIKSGNLNSSECVLFIDDNINNNYANVTGYKNWDTNINTGMDEFSSGVFVNNYGASNPYWCVLSTDDMFYFFVQCESGANYYMKVMFGFGDLIPLFNSDKLCILFAQPSLTYNQPYVGYEKDIKISNGETVNFPPSLFVKSSVSTRFGDRTDSYSSSNTIFSKLPLYALRGDNYTPIAFLNGMLMPFIGVSITNAPDGIDRLANQHPYIEPLFGNYQPWHGRLWFNMDDWGI